MPTEDQKKDAERLRRHIAREGLVSIMNDTKWRTLRSAILTETSYQPRYRVKQVRGSIPSLDAWERDWEFQFPNPALSIEWIDTDPFENVRRGALLDDFSYRSNDGNRRTSSLPINSIRDRRTVHQDLWF
jgi:hypothetical protein